MGIRAGHREGRRCDSLSAGPSFPSPRPHDGVLPARAVHSNIPCLGGPTVRAFLASPPRPLRPDSTPGSAPLGLERRDRFPLMKRLPSLSAKSFLAFCREPSLYGPSTEFMEFVDRLAVAAHIRHSNRRLNYSVMGIRPGCHRNGQFFEKRPDVTQTGREFFGNRVSTGYR